MRRRLLFAISLLVAAAGAARADDATRFVVYFQSWSALLQPEAGEFSLGLLVLVRGAQDFALGFVMLFRRSFQRLLGFMKGSRDAIRLRLHVGHLRFERCNFGVESAKLALHSEWTGFVWTSTGDHASLVTSPIGRYECILRVFARQFLRGVRAVCQISPAKARQELLSRRTEWITEFD